MVKLSKYNIRLGNKYIYNSLNDSIIKDNEGILNSVSKDNNCFINDETKLKLLTHGFIIGDEVNELERIKFIHNREKFNTNHASFILYPSMKCNFNCYYCFEKNKKSIITNENVVFLGDSLVKFTESFKLSKLSLRWSGGEPLLAWGKIKQILNYVIKNTFSNTKILNTIATNGYLLNKKIVQEMVEYDFQNVTITLDGPREIHDISRKTVSGKPTFDKIVKNIEYLCHYIPTTIRMNIDTNNINHFEDLLKQLSDYKITNKEVEIFCKPIIPGWDKSKDCSMIDMPGFFKIEKEFITIAEDYGFKYAFHPNMKAGIRCPFYHINSFIIDPNLYVYKCSLLVGEKEEAIGKIAENKCITIDKVEKYYKSINLSPFDIEECRECPILPLCYGKCPILYEKSGFANNEGCIPEKETIIEKLKYLYNV